ncbi:MAG: LysM domain-containing protein, partial [Propionibacterium sp.]|nr:LysM domain-containing protein [Propionibacterium sp.]
MKRLITSVGSTILLAALVIGSPTALLAWGRLDGLARLSPSALMGPDDGTIVLGLVTVTGWAAWFVFTLSVVIEAVALATHSRVHVTLPGLSLVQGLAAGLLVASLAVLAPAARGSCPTHQNTTVSVVGIDQQTRDDTTVQEGVPGRSGTGGSVSHKLRGSQNRPMEFTEPDSARASGPARKMTAEPGYDMYRISATDDLWSLAERVYGEGTAWHQIARANPGMDVQHLPVGDQIKLPR